MKDIYEKPFACIDEFKAADIITTSVGNVDNEPDTDIPVPWS